MLEAVCEAGGTEKCNAGWDALEGGKTRSVPCHEPTGMFPCPSVRSPSSHRRRASGSQDSQKGVAGGRWHSPLCGGQVQVGYYLESRVPSRRQGAAPRLLCQPPGLCVVRGHGHHGPPCPAEWTVPLGHGARVARIMSGSS